MTLSGGKRKVNKSLKAWVSFVKKVQKEEKLSYKDAIHRAKVRKDKGEKWMSGGYAPLVGGDEMVEDETIEDMPDGATIVDETIEDVPTTTMGGRRRRRTMRRSRGRGRGRGRTARRSRSRASRRY